MASEKALQAASRAAGKEGVFLRKAALALGMAALTALAAQVRIPLPWTPVPITGQTLVPLLAGASLGRWWGSASMALYLALACAGFPWFAGAKGGLGVLWGPTGGYLLGFVLAAYFVGRAAERGLARPLLFGVMVAANFLIIHGLGMLQLAAWYHLQGAQVSLASLFLQGCLPFIPGDLLKAGLAALAAPRLARFLER